MSSTTKIGAKWVLTRSDKRVDVWETIYKPRRPIKLPIGNWEWKQVVRKINERLSKHKTKYAWIRLKLLVEEGLYAVSFTVEKLNGQEMIVEYVGTPTVPRNRSADFKVKELTEVLRETISKLESVSLSSDKEIYIVHFNIVAHDGFWQKVKPANVGTAHKTGRKIWGVRFPKKS